MTSPSASPKELERIERFIAAYNALDDWLQSHLDEPNSFRSAVDFYAKRHPFWRDAEPLRVFAALRNFLVHEKTRPFDYPCVPSENAVEEIEAIRQRALHPETIGQKFGREVWVLRPDDTLEAALKTMKARDVSRFPIYENNRFIGVLGEREVARFLAGCLARGEEFSPQTRIEAALPRETKRPTFRFASPETSVAQAAFWFGENIFLEAILIAPREGARPSGIVTRGDVAGWNE
jgi:CBS domain-containing protein